MGVALALEGAALSIYTAHGHHQRCITVEERVSRISKNEPPVPQVEALGSMVEIARQVLKAVELFRVRHVGIKGYAHDAKWKIHQVGEVAGVVKVYLWVKNKIVAEIIAPSVARKYVLDSGKRVSREELRDMVENDLGVAVKNGLEVDATIVARYLFDRVAAREKEISI
jgi:hypothetical protein